MNNSRIGYEVVKVRGNSSYTWEVYSDKQSAIEVCKVLTNQISKITDEHICYYEVRETKIY
jgi:hypothetical protein